MISELKGKIAQPFYDRANIKINGFNPTYNICTRIIRLFHLSVIYWFIYSIIKFIFDNPKCWNDAVIEWHEYILIWIWHSISIHEFTQKIRLASKHVNPINPKTENRHQIHLFWMIQMLHTWSLCFSSILNNMMVPIIVIVPHEKKYKDTRSNKVQEGYGRSLWNMS